MHGYWRIDVDAAMIAMQSDAQAAGFDLRDRSQRRAALRRLLRNMIGAGSRPERDIHWSMYTYLGTDYILLEGDLALAGETRLAGKPWAVFLGLYSAERAGPDEAALIAINAARPPGVLYP